MKYGFIFSCEFRELNLISEKKKQLGWLYKELTKIPY